MLKFTACVNGEAYCSFERETVKEAIELTKHVIEEDQLNPEEVTLYFFESDEIISFDEVKEDSKVNNYVALEEALKGLRIFQTYRLEANEEEREIIENAMLKVGIEPMQITELIQALQKEV